MKSRNKYLLKNVVSFFFGKVGSKLISFLLVPLYTHVLATGEYGVADLVITASSMMASVVVLEVGEAVMRFCLDKGADKNKVMSVGLALLAAGTVAGLAFIPISNSVSAFSGYGLFVYGCMLSAAYMQVFLSFLRGQEKLNLYAVCNIVHTLSFAGLNILFLVFLRWGVNGYLYANIFSNCLTALLAAVLGSAHRAVAEFCIDTALVKRMVKYSVALVPNTLMWWIINSSDRVMITAMIGSAANGLYAVAYKLPSLLNTFSSTFNFAWTHSAIREKGSVDESEYHNETYNGMVQVLTVVAAGMLLVIKPFLGIYVAPAFFEAWKYTPYLILAFVFLTLGDFVGTAYKVNKNSVQYLLSGVLGAVVNVGLNLLLIPVIGAAGAAVATCASCLSVFVFRLINTRRYIKINALSFSHLLSFGMLFAMAGLMFWETAVSFALSAVLFCGCLFLSRDIVKKTVFTLLKKS